MTMVATQVANCCSNNSRDRGGSGKEIDSNAEMNNVGNVRKGCDECRGESGATAMGWQA